MQSDNFKKLKEDSEVKIGEKIVTSILERNNFSLRDFSVFFTGGGDYDQTGGGNYNQTGGGDHNQGSGGDYTQTATRFNRDQVINPALDIERMRNIIEDTFKKFK